MQDPILGSKGALCTSQCGILLGATTSIGYLPNVDFSGRIPRINQPSTSTVSYSSAQELSRGLTRDNYFGSKFDEAHWAFNVGSS